MTCASCVRTVEKALISVPGVEGVVVNLTTEEATLTSSLNLSVSTLREAVERAGYHASGIRSLDESRKHPRVRDDAADRDRKRLASAKRRRSVG